MVSQETDRSLSQKADSALKSYKINTLRGVKLKNNYVSFASNSELPKNKTIITTYLQL